MSSNYVCNPSFEFKIDSTSTVHCHNVLWRAEGWNYPHSNSSTSENLFEHMGTADIWYNNNVFTPSDSMDCLPKPNLPYTIVGSEMPFIVPGDSINKTMAGIITYVSDSLFTYLDSNYPLETYDFPNYREYLVNKLKDNLKPNTTYTIKFKVSLSEASEASTPIHIMLANSYKVYFPFYGFAGPLYPYLTTSQKQNVVEITSGVTQKNGWTEVSTTFYTGSQNDLKYLFIGNFYDQDSTVAKVINLTADTSYNNDFSTYYFIDDVHVEECSEQIYFRTCGGSLYYSNISSMFNSASNILVDANIIFDINAFVNNKNITFTSNGAFTIQNGVTLNISNSYLHGCGEMWQGIVGQPSSRIIIENSRVEDAHTAIHLNAPHAYKISNNIFDLNKEAIRLNNISSYYHEPTMRIYGNSFLQSDSIKWNNFYNYPTIKGVIIDQSSAPVRIGSSTLAQNLFDSLDVGIEILSSSADIRNNLFTKSKLGIRGVNQNSNLLPNVYIGDLLNSAEKNIILKGNTGIEFTGQFAAYVLLNEIGDVFRGVYVHDVLNNSSLVSGYVIFGNKIQNAGIGVRLENLGNKTEYVIRANLLSNINKPILGSMGVSVVNKMGRLTKCQDPIRQIISDNRIFRFDTGIDLNGAACNYISSNTINTYVAPTEYVQRHGIVSRSALGNLIFANKIKGTSIDRRNIGIRTEQLNLSECYCNTIENTNIGLWGGLTNYDNRYFANYINKTHRGFFVNYGAVGKQMFLRTDPTKTVDPENSIYVQSLNGTTGYQLFTGLGNLPGHSVYYNVFMTIGGANPLWQKTTENWSQQVFDSRNCIKENPPLPKLDSIFVDGYKEMARIFEHTEPITGIYEDNRNFYTELERYSLYLQQDSALQGFEAVQNYVEYLATNREEVLPFGQVYAQLDKGNWNHVQEGANSLPESTPIQEYYKQYAKIYAKYKLYGEDSLQDLDKENLHTIAQTCYYEYGQVVIWSRDFLYNVYNETTDINSCEEFENYGENQEISEEIASVNYFNVYPNPASAQTVLNNSFDDGCIYQVTDMLGTVLQTGNTNLGDTHLPTGFLITGTYYIRILKDNSLIGNLILIKQ